MIVHLAALAYMYTRTRGLESAAEAFRRPVVYVMAKRDRCGQDVPTL